MKKSTIKPKEIVFNKDIGSTYIIYPCGQIVNTASGRTIITWRDNQGYETANLYVNGRLFKVKIHRLVYQTFKGELKKRYIINHKDCNKLNNCVDNLEQIPYSSNTIHWHNNKEACADYNKKIGEMPGFKVIRETVEII